VTNASPDAEPVAHACAGINIALVKYWGKRDEALNLPESGSLSLTLADLGTQTALWIDPSLADDRLELDGAPAPEPVRARASRFLDLVRAMAGRREHAWIRSRSTVPVAAGLASSASSYAALAGAAASAFGLDLGTDALSVLARRGSGSAARSIHGGFVEMLRGERPDGVDCHARPVLAAEAWDVRVVVARTATGEKHVGSSDGMRRTASTSPFHAAFIAQQADDLRGALEAISGRDLPALGALAEANALRMHADALAARPPLLYWNGVTVDALRCVQRLRTASGVHAWATIDAGPHVKALCAADQAEAVAAALAEVPGVLEIRTLHPGPGLKVWRSAEREPCACE
jgi:diphosphomevalonate decarboxylase